MTAIDEIAWLFILLAILSALIIVIDQFTRPRRRMWIMSLVWPLTALYAGPVGLLLYVRLGRHRSRSGSVTRSTLHCGAGCTLGDMVVALLPPILVAGSPLVGHMTLALAGALLFGILFQYFALKTMKGKGFWRTLLDAFKADTLSVLAWQAGMYSGMAIAIFMIFNESLSVKSPVFWWMMQLSMLLGFCTAYPVNFLLVESGLKKGMT